MRRIIFRINDLDDVDVYALDEIELGEYMAEVRSIWGHLNEVVKSVQEIMGMLDISQNHFNAPLDPDTIYNYADELDGLMIQALDAQSRFN